MKLISSAMIGIFNYIGTRLNGVFQEVKLKGKIPQFPQFFCMNKVNRTSHWFGHLKLKYLDTNYLFEIKQMIEDMESEPTEASETNSKTDNLAVTEETTVDEAITA